MCELQMVMVVMCSLFHCSFQTKPFTVFYGIRCTRIRICIIMCGVQVANTLEQLLLEDELTSCGYLYAAMKKKT